MDEKYLYFAEQHYSSAMKLLEDARLISREREFEGVAVLIDAAIRCVKGIGIICEINGQKKLEGGGI